LKHQSLFARLHGAKLQKTAIFTGSVHIYRTVAWNAGHAARSVFTRSVKLLKVLP